MQQNLNLKTKKRKRDATKVSNIVCYYSRMICEIVIMQYKKDQQKQTIAWKDGILDLNNKYSQIIQIFED